jgi:hypothetical protein
LALARYTECKPLKAGGWGYFFHVPSWAKKAGCPVQNAPLGADYDAGVERTEKMLLPAFDEWRTDAAASGSSPTVAAFVTLDWMFAEYRSDRRYTKLDPFMVEHYRPKERPNPVRVIDEKTGAESGIPLFDDAGAALYPELMAELDTIKRERIGGLMLRRDWGQPHMPNFTHVSRKVKEVIRAAGLRDELSFTSFRHGGLTETGDAELTDREVLAQSRHTTVKVLPKYVKRTTKQIATGTRKRPAARTKDGHLSE